MKNVFFLSFLLLAACNLPKQTTEEEIFYTAGQPRQIGEPLLHPIPANDHPPKGEPGKCYGKCVANEKEYKSGYFYLPIYTGNIPQTVPMDTLDYEATIASTKWVKKTANKNCISSNPDDCLVWCLVEIPAEKKRVIFIKDTTRTKEFQMQRFEKQNRILNAKSGVTEWYETLCQNKITPTVVEDICQKLTKAGYPTEAQTELTTVVKSALTQYQKDKHLPFGNLNITTLDALKVKY
ncbi:MAG: hypothetical protein RLZZ292_3966 [Bacteroidota bacterium]|jgi:hypothetical protein